MIKSIIVATAANSAIGKDNDLPWHLPADLKHFKRLTSGHHIIMGRKTYESIGRPLPNRTSLIVSRNPNYAVEGCFTFTSLEKALDFAQQAGEEEAFLIGGAQLYELALAENLVDNIYLTEVATTVDGDAFFPTLTPEAWIEVDRVKYEADEKNPFAYSFVKLMHK
ncbi:MAG: dihydrofolate reductase [Flammeovirgaceae bacterium]